MAQRLGHLHGGPLAGWTAEGHDEQWQWSAIFAGVAAIAGWAALCLPALRSLSAGGAGVLPWRRVDSCDNGSVVWMPEPPFRAIARVHQPRATTARLARLGHVPTVGSAAFRSRAGSRPPGKCRPPLEPLHGLRDREGALPPWRPALTPARSRPVSTIRPIEHFYASARPVSQFQ
jgi:hypothetical protein